MILEWYSNIRNCRPFTASTHKSQNLECANCPLSHNRRKIVPAKMPRGILKVKVHHSHSWDYHRKSVAIFNIHNTIHNIVDLNTMVPWRNGPIATAPGQPRLSLFPLVGGVARKTNSLYCPRCSLATCGTALHVLPT